MLTDKEGELLHGVVEDFWRDFSKLCNESLLKAPPHLREYLEPMLGDKTSFYGRDLDA